MGENRTHVYVYPSGIVNVIYFGTNRGRGYNDCFLNWNNFLIYWESSIENLGELYIRTGERL